MNYLTKFWRFLNEDTWQSWVVSLLLIIIIIKFIFFPGLSLITGTQLPLVVVESCSMYHNSNFNNWWEQNGEWYKSKDITKSEFDLFSFKNGLNKGDIIFVLGRLQPKKGDIIIFQPQNSKATHPIIHRVVTLEPLGTKGDNGKTNPSQLDGNNAQNLDETDIPMENVIGKSIIRIPAVGWIKLIFFEPLKNRQQRGFCR
jgi:signal peptidase I